MYESDLGGVLLKPGLDLNPLQVLFKKPKPGPTVLRVG